MSIISYISEKRGLLLSQKYVLLELKIVELEKCSHCIDATQTRVFFKNHPPL